MRTRDKGSGHIMKGIGGKVSIFWTFSKKKGRKTIGFETISSVLMVGDVCEGESSPLEH